MSETVLALGQNRLGPATALTLPLAALTRHWMALGSSGSGKTVLCKAVVEDCARHGIPVICIDPQGDLCSLALPAVPDNALPDAPARDYANQVETVIFTPAARKGVPLCADPLQLQIAHLPSGERVRVISSAAATLTALLGYDLASDDGEGLSAVLDTALTECHAQHRWPRNLAEFVAIFAEFCTADPARFERYWEARKLEQALKRLARLDVGTRRLLFHEGLALDIDLLLGKVGGTPGKTRISVIYLNTLHTQEDKEFFLATLAERLYAWMLQHPSPQLQAVFYIDEVAPFIPPVRKPACKDALALLFKQARKYGIGCVMATQNPGDVDYKAMAQFGTWALGRLTTAQDLKKVQPTVKALDPVHTDALMGELPAQKAGEFLLLSPDHYHHTQRLQARWLYTAHQTLDEDQIAALTEARWRTRFAALEAALPTATVVMTDAALPLAKPTRQPPQTGRMAAVPELPSATVAEPSAEMQAAEAQLAGLCSQNLGEFAVSTGLSEARARSMLKQLQAIGLVASYKAGRSTRYWAVRNGLRPDLELCAPVKALQAQTTRADIRPAAEALLLPKGLGGWLGTTVPSNVLEQLHLEYRVSLRVLFREKLPRAFWQRLWDGMAHEGRRDSLYLHPRDLHILQYQPEQGIRRLDQATGHASSVQDFDGHTEFESQLPAQIRFDEQEWLQRPREDQIFAHFQRQFSATPESIEPIFIPVWVLTSSAPAQQQVLLLDALCGRLLDW